MPASFMVAWYEPWKSYTAINGVPTIVHKAVGDDIFRQIYPFKILAAEAFSRFRLPLWNPYNGAGQPLMANLHPGYLNPFSLLLNINPISGWAWFILLQLPLLFLTTYWYLQSLKLQVLPSLFGATVFALSGATVARYMYGDYMYAMAMLPLLLFCVEQLKVKNIRVSSFLLPLSTAFLFISVQPQISIYVLVTALLYAGVRLWNERKNLAIFLVLLFLGFGIAGVQLLPTLELLGNANVTTQSSSFIFEKFLMPVSHLITVVIPNYFGNSGTYNFWGKTDYIETVFSMGLIPVLFALMAFGRAKNFRSLRIFFGLLFVCTVLLTINWWLPKFLYSQSIPILSTSIPTRIYLLSTFALSVLSAMGINEYKKKQVMYVAYFMWIVVLVGLFVVYTGGYLGLSCLPQMQIDCKNVAIRNGLLEFGLFSILLVPIVFSKYVTHVALVLVLVGGIYNAGKILPMSPASHVMPDHEVMTALKAVSPNRVFGFGEASMASDLASYYRFFDLNYYDPLYIKRYGKFISFVNTGDTKKGLMRSDVAIVNDILVNKELSDRRQRAFDLLGVTTFLEKKNDAWVFTDNKTAMPRVSLIYNIEVEPNENTLLARLFSPSFSYRDTALVEENIPFIKDEQYEATGSATIVEYLPEKVVIHVATKRDGLLVLSDTFENGWKATVDGIRAISVYRTNYTFRSVVVPRGEHEIVFFYEPRSVRVGLYVTLISSFFVLLFSLGVQYGKIKF